MIRVIISMHRADAGYPHNFRIDSEVIKDEGPKLKLKPTTDIECVCSWSELSSSHAKNMHKAPFGETCVELFPFNK